MKFFIFFAFALSVFTSKLSLAQSTAEAQTYFLKIASEHYQIAESFMEYASSVAHNSIRKSEKKRAAMLGSIQQVKNNLSAMPCYYGQCELRDSTLAFLTMYNLVINEDYAQILNLEEIAEQSFDNMEAYFLAKELAANKVEQCSKRLDEIEDAFIALNQIHLVEQKSELTKKIEQTNAVNKHYNEVYLIFFKSYKQEVYMLEALEQKNYSSAEQNRDALANTANEGIALLKTTTPFRGDRSLILACHKSLTFYRTEATEKIKPCIEYMLLADNFDKIQGSLEAKDPMLLTPEEVSAYNNAVKEINVKTPVFKNNLSYLDQNRQSTVNNWNTVSKAYIEKNVPRHK